MTVFEIILTCIIVLMFAIIFAHISCVKEGLEYKKEFEYNKLQSDINWLNRRFNSSYLKRGSKFRYRQLEYEVILKDYNDIICKQINTDKISTFNVHDLVLDHSYICIMFNTDY